MVRWKYLTFLYCGAVLLTCIGFLSFHYSSRERSHLITKRSAEQLPPNVDTVLELQPGQLICELPKFVNLNPGETKPPSGGDKEETDREGPIIIPPVDRNPNKKLILTGWTDKKRNIGCCPSGDRNGVPFQEGMACCVGHIYNASEKFCCLSKSRPYSISERNLEFCYPFDRIPYCRLSDLDLDNLRPLDVVCKTKSGKKKSPSECTFICPSGSQVRGDKRVTCSDVGTWNNVDPQCCEGCPTDFKQDIWFVVDIDQNIGVGNLSSIRTFIRLLTGYFPIGQDKVRVAMTPYNGRLFTTQGGWYLDRYDTAEMLNDAINDLPREGSGRQTGEALEWLAVNAFNGKLGDRPDVPNSVVLITTGPPDDDNVQEAAEALQSKSSRLAIIAVGPNAQLPEWQHVAYIPAFENYLFVPTFHYLDEHVRFLYNLFCQGNCLETEALPK